MTEAHVGVSILQVEIVTQGSEKLVHYSVSLPVLAGKHLWEKAPGPNYEGVACITLFRGGSFRSFTVAKSSSVRLPTATGAPAGCNKKHFAILVHLPFKNHRLTGAES
jgi:hypothetical protein